MKLFRYAASLLTLAMLGACSSEEPLPVNGGASEGTSGMYLSITVDGTKSTRATQPALDKEKEINKIQIIVTKKSTNKEFINQTITATDVITKEDGTDVKQINGSTILFAVDNVTFNEMKLNADATDWEILVYVNGPDDAANRAALLTGSTGASESETWGIKNAEDRGYNTYGFTMSNAKECLGKLAAIGSSDGSTPEKAWLIKADVELSRLATRFDYVKNHDNTYTLLSDNSVTLKVAGIGVNTFASKTYRIAQFSSDGKVPTGGVANCTHYVASTDAPYRVTDSYDGEDENTYMAGSYADARYYLIPDTKETIYMRPNTLSYNKDFVPSFNKVPYAAIKAQIILNNAGTESSYAKGESLFAMNGILIGGARDLKKLDVDGEEFAVNFDTTGLTTTEKEDIEKAIEDVVTAVNNYIEGHNFSDLSVAGNLTKENNNIKEFLQAEEYTRAADGKYYTYYATYILHDKDSKDNAWLYGVSRNTVYQLGVESFGFLGNNGKGKIGDGPKPSNIQDLIMKLSITIKDWELNDINSGWKL
ncbi:MAG: fimbria major subunit [Muribaculaceae bacterium]|nr:fimbria major subunit [Muribaculaceae bacterium]